MIEVERISYRYPETEPVLKDVSFAVGEGEKVVLLGANGCGKTTLLRVLNGLIFPQEGCFRYKGEAVTARRKRKPVVRVRSGPRGRALSIDGTFASWYRPGSSLTGSVWDALATPLGR